MKIQNTITQAQLEMLLRLANAMHTANAGWRYGQSVANAVNLLLPDLANEIGGNPSIDPFHWLEDHGARWTQWYATVCPDPPREEDRWEEIAKHPGLIWFQSLTKEEQIALEKKYGYHGHDEGTSEKEVILMYRDETGLSI